MGMVVQEVYNPQPLAANSTTTIFAGPGAFGGFLCTTAGQFTLQDASGSTLIATVSLSAGQMLPVGFVCGNGAKVLLAAGCAGTALYSPNIN
jgi:hypothetical protein